MILKVINHDFIYEMSHLCTVFFPFEKIKDDGEDNIEVVTSANGMIFLFMPVFMINHLSKHIS